MPKPKYKRMLAGLKPEATPQEWFAYILECADGTFYTGITNCLEKRIETHNKAKGARYTRTRLPVKLVYWESCKGRSEALIRECKIKALPKDKKRELVALFESSSNLD